MINCNLNQFETMIDVHRLYRRENANSIRVTGADLGFQVRGAHFKKMRRAQGGAKIFGVFRVKNHDLTPKKSYFFQF